MSVLDNPVEESYMLVEFEYGSPATFARYTDRIKDAKGGLFKSTTSMKVVLPENTGVFDQKVCRIVLPRVTAGVTDTFLDRISDGLPHAPTTLTVTEIVTAQTGGVPSEVLRMFFGRAQRAIRNYQGREDVVAIEALPVRSLLKSAMGLACNHHCTFNLFGRGCSTGNGIGGAEPDGTAPSGPQIGLESVTATLNTIAGKTITMSSLPAKPDDRHWHRGYVEYLGLRIGIRDFDASVQALELHLVNRPPQDWLGNSIKVVPGCDKSVETCRSRWNNEEHFGGFGYAIPAYNPLLESPT